MTKEELKREVELLNKRIKYECDNTNKAITTSNERVREYTERSLREDYFLVKKFIKPDSDNPLHWVVGIVLTACVLISFFVGISHASKNYDQSFAKCNTPPEFIYTRYNPAYKLGCLIGRPLKEKN